MKLENNHLLVVDDEENNRDMLSRRLERSGFAVDSASCGKEALERVEQTAYDLVLLDQMMPDLTGMDVLRLLRATHSPEQLPVIMVTAVTESEKIVEAIGLGANDYVTKPVDYPVALARINAQLSRKMAGSALRESEERYALAAKGSNDGLWDWDLRSHRIYYSPRWKEMLGYGDDEIGDGFEEWFGRVPQPDRSALWSAMEAHWNSRAATPVEFEHRITRKDGTCAWFVSRGLAVRDHNGSAIRMAGSSSDVTSRKAYDALTALPNRLFLEDRISQALRRQRENGAAFAAVVVDLDRFRVATESLGATAGDTLLLQVADRLRGACGTESLLTRLENDEFAALFYDINSAEDAKAKAESLLERLRSPFVIGGTDFVSRGSVGIVISDLLYKDGSEILRDANTAMTVAQAKGGDRAVLFDHSLRTQMVADLKLETDLQKAVENSELRDYYQPKVRLDTGKIVGFEALIRWQHPERGLVSPSDFIPIAEQSGSIVSIGRWILRAACQQLRVWNEARRPEDYLKISVNVSPRQFLDRDLAAYIQATIEACGIQPEWLDLEITEGVLMHDAKVATGILQEMKAVGVGLKLDDFGTGYSSLSYLRDLPFDTLKIDQSFVRELAGNGTNQELVKTMLSMAHELGMDVVAEGVETEEEAAMLRSMGCEYGQGYLYSRPVPAEKAAQLLKMG